MTIQRIQQRLNDLQKIKGNDRLGLIVYVSTNGIYHKNRGTCGIEKYVIMHECEAIECGFQECKICF
jgi:hypothetical protein